MTRKRTKGAIVLELLREGAFTMTELLVNSALEPFRHSYRGGLAPLRGKDFSIRDMITEIKENRKERRRFYNLLLNLKRDGLIVKDSSSKEGNWLISKKGIAELEKQPEKRYPRHRLKEIIVISYDIPEKYRKARGWLRSILKFLDFKMLHQSVWLGKTEIPETLLTDLHERKINSFVHVFTIGKRGSLTQIL